MGIYKPNIITLRRLIIAVIPRPKCMDWVVWRDDVCAKLAMGYVGDFVVFTYFCSLVLLLRASVFGQSVSLRQTSGS